MAICPNCKREINNDSSFCQYCGIKFAPDQLDDEYISHADNQQRVEVIPDEPKNMPKKKIDNKMKIGLISVGIIIVAVLAVILIFVFAKPTSSVEPLTDAEGNKMHEGFGTVEMAVRDIDDQIRVIKSDKRMLTKESILEKYTSLLDSLKQNSPSFSCVKYQNLPTDHQSLGPIGNVVLPLIEKYVTSKSSAETVNYGVGNADKLPLMNNAKGCLLTNTTLIKNAYCEILNDGKYKLVITLVDEKDPVCLTADATQTQGTINSMFTPYDAAKEISAVASLALTDIVFNYTNCTAEVIYDKKTEVVESIKQTMNIDTCAATALFDISARIVDITEYSNIQYQETK